MADAMERILRLKQEAFQLSPATLTPSERNMWAAIDKLELTLDGLLTELENLMAIRKLRGGAGLSEAEANAQLRPGAYRGGR